MIETTVMLLERLLSHENNCLMKLFIELSRFVLFWPGVSVH